jgi:hypothetical protein
MTTNPAEPQPPEQPATEPAAPAAQPAQPMIELGEQPGAELRTELAAAGRPTSKVTLILVGVVVLVVGFLGGILTHRAYAGSGSTTGGTQAAGPNGGNGNRGYGFGRPGASGAPNGGTGTGTGFGGTAGTVDHVSGNTVYVKTSDGKIIKVTVGSGTTIEVTKDGKVTDLSAGQTVVVQGQTGSDGSVSANRITEGQQGFGRGARPSGTAQPTN